MAKNAAVTKFNTKIETLEKETGFKYKIEVPDFEKIIEENRLFADWFEPGTVLARVEGESATLVYEIDGPISARLNNKQGAAVAEFIGFLEPYKDDDVALENDKDLEALLGKKHASGFSLDAESRNSVFVYVEDSAIDPIVIEDSSVARCILNKELAVGLMERALEEGAAGETSDSSDDTSDFAGGFEVDDKDRLPDKKINDALDAALEALEGNDGFDLPDRPSAPEEDDTPPMIPDDIPEYSEYMKEKEKAEKEAEKAEKKQTKKAAKTTEKPAKSAKTGDSEGDIPRYDLLPLGIIGAFIERYDVVPYDLDFFASIEAYKSGEGSLLDAAIAFTKSYCDGYVEAIDALAERAEEVADYAECDVTTCINKSIRSYLLCLKDWDKELVTDVLVQLIKAAGAAK